MRRGRARQGQGGGIALFIVFASAVALAVALTSQYAFGLAPCVLCLYQRIPYAIAIVFGLLALPFGKGPIRPMLLVLVALAFAVNAGIALFHAGVEWHWWAGLSGCTGGTALPTNTQDLFAAMSTPAPARCDEAAWTLFGLSMAGYNVFASAFLSIVAAIGARRAFRD
jgi:disulfide bond formation protein DsbB